MSFQKKGKHISKYQLCDQTKKIHFKLENVPLKQKSSNKKIAYPKVINTDMKQNSRLMQGQFQYNSCNNILTSTKNCNLKRNNLQKHQINEQIINKKSQQHIQKLLNQITNFQLIYQQCKHQSITLHQILKVKDKQIYELKQTIKEQAKINQTQKFISHQFKGQINVYNQIFEQKQDKIFSLQSECLTHQQTIKTLSQQLQMLKGKLNQKSTFNQQKICKMFQDVNKQVNNYQCLKMMVKKDNHGEYSFGDCQVKRINQYDQYQNIEAQSDIKQKNQAQQSQQSQIDLNKYLRDILRKNQQTISDYQQKIKSLQEDLQYFLKHKQIQIQNIKVSQECKYARLIMEIQTKMSQQITFLIQQSSIKQKQLIQKNDQLTRLRQKIDNNNKNHQLQIKAFQKANQELIKQIQQLKMSTEKDLLQFQVLLQKQHQIQVLKIIKQDQKQKNELKARVDTLKLLLQQKNHQIGQVLEKKDEIIRIVTQKNQKLIDYKVKWQKLSNSKNKMHQKCVTQIPAEKNRNSIQHQNVNLNLQTKNQNSIEEVFQIIQLQQTQNLYNKCQNMQNERSQEAAQKTNRMNNSCKHNRKILLQKQKIILYSLQKYLKNK